MKTIHQILYDALVEIRQTHGVAIEHVDVDWIGNVSTPDCMPVDLRVGSVVHPTTPLEGLTP